MSVYRRICDILKENQLVNVHAVIDENYLPGSNSFWHQFITIVVYPVDGMYSIVELNTLMNSLIPESIQASTGEMFREECDSMYFGDLRFDENFGTKTESFCITDEDLYNFKTESGYEVTDGKFTVTKDLKRRIFVKLYPSKEVVDMIYAPDGTKHIDPEADLRTYKIGIKLLRDVTNAKAAQSV